LSLYAVRRLEAALHAGEELFSEQGMVTWNIPSDQTSAMVATFLSKACSYQVREGRDLMCSAASADDQTAVGRVGLHRLAPTSKHQCQQCDLPDEGYLCSHLIHPQVGAQTIEEGVTPRSVWAAVCDVGQPFVNDSQRCRAGGHGCWQRIVHPTTFSQDRLSPLALIDELDFLDAAWRLLFGTQHGLLDLSTVSEPAGLAQACSDRATFEARLSDLADIFDRFKIGDDLLPEGLSEDDTRGSLNRMEQALKNRLSAEATFRTQRAIGRLRLVRHVRNALQHSGAANDLPRVLGQLGVDAMPQDWAKVWDQLRSTAAQAVAAVRAEVRRESARP
jgi:hypothetical protein